MLFSVGTKVKFIHTGELGEIVEILDKNTVLVALHDADGFEIPTDVENVVVLKENEPYNPFQKKTTTPIPPAVEPVGLTKKLPKLTRKGVQLAFEPVFNAIDGTIDHFDVFLVNDTPYRLLFSTRLEVKTVRKPEKNGILEAQMVMRIGRILQYELSDHPAVLLELRQVTTEGTGEKVEKNVKIKAKQFFSKVKNVGFTATPCYVYDLIENFEAAVDSTENEDLKTYTQKHLKEQEAEKEEDFYVHVRRHDIHQIKDLAEFPEELDLHIERLTDTPSALTPAQILHLQLQVFDEYLEQAIRLGVPKVHVIHGLGKGRLRNEIQKRLQRNPHIRLFANEHHAKYGFGATEIYIG